METKIRGFFGIARNGKPTYFGGPPNQFYVVELADDGIFFAGSDGIRKPSQCSDNEEAFSSFIESGSWLKFEGGNPFPSSTQVRYGLERWVTRAVGGTGKQMRPHWRNDFWCDTEDDARQQIASFDKRSKWRVVRVTREVLP